MDKYPFKIEMHPESENIELCVIFNSTLNEISQKEIQSIFTSWYVVAMYGGFGIDRAFNMGQVWVEKNEVGCSIDFGGSDPNSLDVILKMLVGFSEFTGLEIKKVVVS